MWRGEDDTMRTSFIVWYAVLQHVFWALLLVIDPRAAWCTGLHSILDIFSGSVSSSIAMLVLATITSMVALFMQMSLLRFMLLIPQQLILLISGIGAIHAMRLSQFADGVVRPWAFIAADQTPYVLVAALHTLAILDHHRWRSK